MYNNYVQNNVNKRLFISFVHGIEIKCIFAS